MILIVGFFSFCIGILTGVFLLCLVQANSNKKINYKDNSHNNN